MYYYLYQNIKNLSNYQRALFYADTGVRRRMLRNMRRQCRISSPVPMTYYALPGRLLQGLNFQISLHNVPGIGIGYQNTSQYMAH